jgi:UDP-N-acetyl-D-mannosaminuronic acid dehydrogenase
MGYIGLPTAIIFANKGFKVSGCDVNPKIVEAINNKTPLIQEPELIERLSKAVDSGNLKAYTAPQASDVYIIAVPTPVNHETKAPDLCYVVSATKSILLFSRRATWSSSNPPFRPEQPIISSAT